MSDRVRPLVQMSPRHLTRMPDRVKFSSKFGQCGLFRNEWQQLFSKWTTHLSPTPSSCSSPSSSRKIIIFNVEEDLALLTEVVATEDPLSRPAAHECWATIGASCWPAKDRRPHSQSSSYRAEKLVKKFKTEDSWTARQ